MRVLFVSSSVPSPLRSRPYAWIKSLAALGHDVELFTLSRNGRDAAALADVRRYCASVTVEPLPSWRPWLNGLQTLADRDPFQVTASRHPVFAEKVRTAAAGGVADVAHIEHPAAACFAPMVSPLPTVYDAVGSFGQLAHDTRRCGPRSADRWGAAIELRRTRAFEREMLYRFERVLVSSPIDGSRLRDAAATAAAASRLVIVPSPVDLDYFRPGDGAREPATLLFLGTMSFHANVAAVRRLVVHIMPRVWQERPDVRVLIVGRGPGREVRAFARDSRIAVTGYVDDIRVFLARATMAVCPAIYGVGTHHMVLEAMASGVPVLASHRAVEALDAEPGVHLAVADSAEDFAAGILHLLDAPADRRTLASRGRAYVAAHHQGPLLGRTLERAYHEAIYARRERS